MSDWPAIFGPLALLLLIGFGIAAMIIERAGRDQ
jgi:hypothetical protein